MDYTMINQLPGLMVAVDFEKAFDSISLNFLLQALRSFNFGPSFIKWVSVLVEGKCRFWLIDLGNFQNWDNFFPLNLAEK